MTQPIDEVLALLHDGFERSVERLSALLRIPSIGTDPAYQAATREAANKLARRALSIDRIAATITSQ